LTAALPFFFDAQLFFFAAQLFFFDAQPFVHRYAAIFFSRALKPNLARM
jgi:hypothetical protein